MLVRKKLIGNSFILNSGTFNQLGEYAVTLPWHLNTQIDCSSCSGLNWRAQAKCLMSTNIRQKWPIPRKFC